MSEESANLERLFAWRSVIDAATYYELLGIPNSASPKEIKSAWHRFALAFHPDGHLDNGPEALAAAQEVFHRGAEGYRVLMDRQLRGRYDMALAKGESRLDAPSDSPPPRSSSNIKTLEDLARSAAAKMCARRADELISEGDLRLAQKELKMAVYHDGGDNRDLEERLEALDLVLFASGD
jgi:curved DNA-binding protein CbpA